MKTKKLAIAFATLALVAAAITVAAVPSFAQSAAQTATPQAQATAVPKAGQLEKGLRGPGPGFGGLLGFDGNWTVFDAQAKALNLTPTQLFEQLHGGKSLSDIATAQGVTLDSVQAAVNAIETQATTDEIVQAVKDGTMTQAQADWMLQGLSQGFLGGGRGVGPMMGGPRGGNRPLAPGASGSTS